jgi:hypothetical protein
LTSYTTRRDTTWLGPRQPWITACSGCVQRHRHHTDDRAAQILRYARGADQVCVRHRRWMLAADPDGPHSIDLTDFPEVMTAHRHHRRLLRTYPHAEHALGYAAGVVWTWRTHHGQEDLIWIRRTRTLAHAMGADERSGLAVAPHPLITYPETIAVAETLASPYWQRRLTGTDPHSQAHANTVGELRAALAHRTSRPGLIAHLKEQPKRRRRSATTPDPLNSWVTTCSSAHNTSDRSQERLWTLPAFTRFPNRYRDRMSFLTEERDQPMRIAKELNLIDGWNPPAGRTAPTPTNP